MFVNHVLIMFFRITYFLESISRRYTECDVKSHSFSPCFLSALDLLSPHLNPVVITTTLTVVKRARWGKSSGREKERPTATSAVCCYILFPIHPRPFILPSSISFPFLQTLFMFKLQGYVVRFVCSVEDFPFSIDATEGGGGSTFSKV